MINGKLLLFAFLICSNAVAAQSYKDMMYDPQYNFYDVIDSAELYFSTHDRGKGSGYNAYLRWKHENEPRYYPTGNREGLNPYLAAESYSSLSSGAMVRYKNGLDNGWVDLGPYDANNITSHYSSGIGRVECFYVCPSDSNLLYMGSRSGGFWRTEDEGKNWENTTDQLVASGVNTLSVSPVDPLHVLINIRNASNGISHGIYRSLNGGKTWNLSTFNPANLGQGGLGSYFVVNKIAFHPLDSNLVFVCTNTGLYRSDDALQTYTLVRTGNISDIEFHPTDADVIYYFNRSFGSVIYKSQDRGLNFVTSGAIIGNSAVSYIAVTASNPDQVYVASSNGVWKSSDKAASFEFLSNPDESCAGFAVSDLNADIMIYGYVDAELSTDGGNSFNQITSWSSPFSPAYIHADIRTLECLAGRFYVGTDGYFCKTNNRGATWTKLNDGTGVRENYALGVSQSNWRRNMCGSQDNGTSIYTENGWIEWNGGDGMEAIIHPLNDDWMMGSWQFGSRSITTDGGMSRQACNNPRRGDGEAEWEAPLLMHPHRHMQIFHFADSIFISKDFGLNWEFHSAPAIGGIQLAAISESNPNYLMICRYGVLKLSIDGGKTFSSMASRGTAEQVTGMAFHPEEENIIVITYGSYAANNQKVFITYNAGQSWHNITYNLGNMPLHCVVLDQGDSNYIYVGAEIGVYYKSLQGTHWQLFNENLPNVSIKDLEIHRGTNVLRAAAWGRGLWEASLLNRQDYPAITNSYLDHNPSLEQPFDKVDEHVHSLVEYNGTLSEVYILYALSSANPANKIAMTGENGIWTTVNPMPSAPVGTDFYFRVYAIGESGDTSKTALFMYTTHPTVYCTAEGASGTGADFIDRVSLDDAEFTSTQEFYGDFTYHVFNLHRGDSVKLEVKLNYHWANDTVFAWIDFNHDYVFDEQDQIVMTVPDENHIAAGWVRVPENASADTVRMRVRNQYWTRVALPCGLAYGEVEDYSVLVLNEAGVPAKYGPRFNLYPNPGNGQIFIELLNNTSGMVAIYDMTGRICNQAAFMNAGVMQIQSNLGPGIYLVHVSTENGTSVKKLIIE